MSVITSLLDDLAVKRSEIEALEAKIAIAAQNLIEEKAALEVEAKGLEAKIRDAAKYIPKSKANTLVGALLQLVWHAPGPKLEESRVLSLLEKYNEIAEVKITEADLKVESNPYWSIRKRSTK